MCGIVGVYDPTGCVDRRLIEKMNATVSHRGPDGRGIYLERNIGLGHSRLKVLDLSDRAKQPMMDADGCVAVSLNGEIYNYRQLKKELDKKYQFMSKSDTEVLVYGYKEWGTAVFDKLNGMFAIAVWDRKEKKLILARDRIGKKPLFYFWNGKTCVFGSELKSLLLHPNVTKEIDEESMAKYFTFGYVPSPFSIFKNIKKVLQGSFIVFKNEKMDEIRFWDLPVSEMRISEEDALYELEALLEKAVAIRLESDVPLGFLLSGGVDSTLIAAIGKRVGADIHTFSIGFRNKEYDEAPDARRIARYLGAKHTELYLDERDFLSFINDSTTFFDEPFADSSLIPSRFLSEITKRHVTVALSGDGGDELFGGYTKYVNLRQALPLYHLPIQARRLSGYLLSMLPFNKAEKAGWAVRSETREKLLQWLVSIWKTNELHQLFPRANIDWSETLFWQTLSRFSGRDIFTRLMAADIKTYLCDDILQKVDRSSMSVALETRCPFLDYRVVEFAIQLPLCMKYRRLKQKYILKKLLERYVPRHLWDRQKHGFNVPIREWYRNGRREEVKTNLRYLRFKFSDVLSGKMMERIYEDHLTGRFDYSQKLFSLDMLALWAQRYLQ